MIKGDHLKVMRTGYSHHGIYLGNGKIIHYSGEVGQKQDASIRIDSIKRFQAGSQIEVVFYGQCDSTEETIKRAHSRLGENGYDLFGNNCEHFARWCKTGIHESEQVEDAKATLMGTVGGGAATTVAMTTVASTGTVVGLSGSGIMSGLATTGGVVGGGAVAGIGVLGAAPALVAKVAMNKVLADGEHLSKDEREARTAGRHATTVGAVAGTAGTIGTIAATGTTAGLSGAGITSGLAAIGGSVGGGMAAGTAIAVAAPAAVAVGVGYGAYKVWKWISD